MKDKMIKFLESYNKTNNEKVTRLYYMENDVRKFVEDYSFFTNKNFITDELRKTLSSGKTLSSKLEDELKCYQIEANYEDLCKKRGVVISDANGKTVLNTGGITADNIILNEKLSFQDFQQQALHRLQRQFLNTPDTKDTVLTRMNIIQMIKDLKELGLK